MADQWDELFGGAAPQQATGAAPKQTTEKPAATTPKPNPVLPTMGDDDFDAFLSGTDNDPEPDDAPGDAAKVSQAKATLAGILTEEKKSELPTLADVAKTYQPAPAPAPAPKKRGRPVGSKNADKPLTAEQFVEKMKPENAEGNRTPEETFRPELVPAVTKGEAPGPEAVAGAIAILARFIKSI